MARHFADCEAVHERPRRLAHQGGRHLGEWRAHWPRDVLAPERVRAVEDDHLDVRLGGGAQAAQQRGGVGVEADAGVLHVDHQGVDAGEVRRGRRGAVDADHRQPARCVAAVRHCFPGGGARGEPVLGGVQPHEVEAALA